MPAAAVRQEGQALFIITGRKACVGSLKNYILKTRIMFRNIYKIIITGVK